MVLLVTGLCDADCFYCPLSAEKSGRDVVYANERPVDPDDMDSILEEARLMGATGTGITGGDPLRVTDRTVGYIHTLKDAFGPGHHIHLYTASEDAGAVRAVEDAGLDEIRFHPPPSCRDPEGAAGYEPLSIALGGMMKVGVEIPSMPGQEERTVTFLRWLAERGVHFVNLNELEFSETNADALKAEGYEVKDDVSAGVAGSEETALEVARRLRDEGCPMPVHYCSSSFKDRVQLRARLRRRAASVIRPFEVLTDDDTLLFGIVVTGDPAGEGEELARELEIPADLWAPNPARGRVEMAPWVLEEAAQLIDRPCYLIEEYPSYDRLEVERRPLK